jgi:hypothetical protein
MSQHGRDNNNNMKNHSPEPIALGSGLFFVLKLLIYIFLLVLFMLEHLCICYYFQVNNKSKGIEKGYTHWHIPFFIKYFDWLFSSLDH